MQTSSPVHAAVIHLAAATAEQRAVLESLSDEELQVLASVRERMAATADIEGHDATAGGWLW